MMIELGEADVLKWQILQAFDGVADRGAAITDFTQQQFYFGAIHQRFSFAVV
jgi:hypothetical protein